MSEELETSLQQSIETYINERLRTIDEQIGRLQTDFNEALARLRESAGTGEFEGSPVASTISAHLQAAREQKLSGPTAAPTPGSDISVVKRAIEEIQNQKSQSDALGALLRNAAQFADRAVLFVVKGEQAIAWRMCQAPNRSNLERVAGVAVSLSGDSVVSQSIRSGGAETASGTSAEDRDLTAQLSGDAQQLAAMPLVVRKKVVAVLYVDSAWPHRDAIQLDALESLTRVAGLVVELVSSARAAQPQQVSAPASAPVEAPAPPEPEVVAPPAVAEAISEEPTQAEETQAESLASEAEATQPETTAPFEPVVEPVPETAGQPAPVVAQEADTMPLPAEPTVEKPAESFTPQYSTPLGNARRYGVAEPELPIEVGEDERRLHNDARRFARLLVSEIKLYNEKKVTDGRSQGNIYDQLREDIDRSRQMYDKRVAAPVAARHDYFHQELVNTLAEGDPSKLGNSYPGAAIGVS